MAAGVYLTRYYAIIIGFVEVDDIHYFRTYRPHSCTGNEQQFSECNFSTSLKIGTQVCSSVRLDCTAGKLYYCTYY